MAFHLEVQFHAGIVQTIKQKEILPGLELEFELLDFISLESVETKKMVIFYPWYLRVVYVC